MSKPVNRRNFLKTGTLAGGAAIGLAGLPGSGLQSNLWAADAEKSPGAPSAEKLGWRLGCQAWTFNSYTFFEAIEKTAALGLHFIEAFPGQTVSKSGSEKFGAGMSDDARKDVKSKLSDSGVKLVNFGVVGIDGRKTFDFAKEMGIETIVSEPSEAEMPKLAKLCDEYEINIAIHDHPKPSHYWNPDTVLKATKGLSKRVGACCDTGHWPRSGLNALECIRKLEGRIISFHFKDLNEKGPKAHDVPWGTGINDIKGMMTEVHRQGLKPVFSIEYEYNWTKSMPDLVKCVAYFEKVCKELAG
jgi:sugar phosphate isomerase/epimerase